MMVNRLGRMGSKQVVLTVDDVADMADAGSAGRISSRLPRGGRRRRCCRSGGAADLGSGAESSRMFRKTKCTLCICKSGVLDQD